MEVVEVVEASVGEVEPSSEVVGTSIYFLHGAAQSRVIRPLSI